MTSSPYPSKSFLLRQSQAILGVWRPEIFSNIPRPIVTILGDVVWLPEIFSNDPSSIVTPGDRLAALVADEQREALATRELAAKPDLKTVKRDDYKAECMVKFGITDRGYQLRGGPAAAGCDVLIFAPEAGAPVADEQREALATKREARPTNEALAIEWLAAKPDLKTVKRDHYKAECMERFRNHRTMLSISSLACRAPVERPEEMRKARSQEANQKINCCAYS